MDGTSPLSIREKLARVGLELISEEEALIPAREWGRYVPCRVLDGFSRPALEPHPAGYLLVGAAGRESGSARDTRRALAAWSPGSLLELRVRRNSYMEAGSEWWESDVAIWLP